MPEETISRREHEEFARRIDAENNRQNRRIEILENSMESLQSLAQSVNKLAVNMESMIKEQEKQGERLEKLESRDGERWRSVTLYVITTIIGIVIGFAFKAIGL